jgi:AraC-like DNA-binding protein
MRLHILAQIARTGSLRPATVRRIARLTLCKHWQRSNQGIRRRTLRSTDRVELRMYFLSDDAHARRLGIDPDRSARLDALRSAMATLSTADRAICDAIMESPTLTDAAAVLGISARHLRRQVKRLQQLMSAFRERGN